MTHAATQGPAEGGIGRGDAVGPPFSSSWQTARGAVSLARPVVVGILTVTPDSFWSGSRLAGVDTALAAAEGMIADGAGILDIGGESTRPGARSLDAAEEIERVAPVIREIARRWPGVPLSVDTVKSSVAASALAEGAAIINDVSGLRLDAAIATTAANNAAGLIIMHSRGNVETMASYDLAQYDGDIVDIVASELREAAALALAAGVRSDAIVLDPGLGFAKRTAHSMTLLARLGELSALGFPLMAGPSRKRFIGELTGGLPVEERLEGTLAACVIALAQGARLFRVHDVRAARRALDVAEAILTHQT